MRVSNVNEEKAGTPFGTSFYFLDTTKVQPHQPLLSNSLHPCGSALEVCPHSPPCHSSQEWARLSSPSGICTFPRSFILWEWSQLAFLSPLSVHLSLATPGVTDHPPGPVRKVARSELSWLREYGFDLTLCTCWLCVYMCVCMRVHVCMPGEWGCCIYSFKKKDLSFIDQGLKRIF